MQTNKGPSVITMAAINKCAQLYPKGCKLRIQFGTGGMIRRCTVAQCFGAGYYVNCDHSHEKIVFFPDLHPHEKVPVQQVLFGAALPVGIEVPDDIDWKQYALKT